VARLGTQQRRLLRKCRWAKKKERRRSADLLHNKQSKYWHKTAKGPFCAEESGLHLITHIDLAN
jgi:hypothetical protein